MPLVATNIVPAPVKLVGPKVVRVEDPKYVAYTVATPAPAPAAQVNDLTFTLPAYPPVITGPAISPEIPHSVVTLFGDNVPVTFIGICSWIDYKYGKDWSKHPSYAVTCKALSAWCKWHKAHDYSAPRESFSTYQAVHEARSKGLAIVVVEDLS